MAATKQNWSKTSCFTPRARMQAPTEIPPGEEETLYFQPTKNRATNYSQHTRCPRGWTTLGHHLMAPSVMTWLCLRNTMIKQQPVYCLPGNVTQAGSHLRVRAVIYPSHLEHPWHNQASLPLPSPHIHMHLRFEEKMEEMASARTTPLFPVAASPQVSPILWPFHSLLTEWSLCVCVRINHN